ncbi:MAG: histidine kinase [Thermoanaerobaculia bacterium]|nr:MAG: histidine kinase [Thermoanaerobaculia bacterium]
MRHRVTEILLVASPYDAFVLGEAGELGERLLGEFRNLDLHYAPALTSVATGAEALALASEQRRFGVILTTPHLADMNGAELALHARSRGIEAPVVLLAWDSSEIKDLAARSDLSAVERSFVWLGDARILVAILKLVEDRRNARHDVAAVGVQVILLIEDSVRNYSSFLPVIYSELFHHSRRLIAEGVNLSQKILRMRARPKILLATSYEEAEQAFGEFHEDVLGIISDVEFPEGGEKRAEAGVQFARRVRAAHPDIPIILHSSKAANAALAESVGAAFLLKGSAVVLQQLRRVMLEDFAFGDFVFRDADGGEVARATDLRSLEAELARVPEESIVRHASRNHFSRWLKARTEFALAHELRPRRPEDYPDVAALRRGLIEAVATYRRAQGQAVVADFDRESFELTGDFHRLGGGSIGGKARGLAFVRRLLTETGLRGRFPGVEIAVPRAVVVATDVFDRFLDDNDLRSFAIECEDEAEIERRFAEARFPEPIERELAALFEREREPVAVRSSSLLEDSHHQPFTGVYDTRMLANDEPDPAARLRAALCAIRRVYASVFRAGTKSYLRATSYRLEEEKMAVLLQSVVGARRGQRYYPDLAGVVRSHNYYPEPGTQPDDGVAAVALGLGRLVAEGGACRRFCPRHPLRGPLAATPGALLESTQRGFWALPLGAAGHDGRMSEAWYELAEAEADGTLEHVASTWSPEDDTLSDGLARRGVRVVTFAPLLRHSGFPLAEILAALAEEGERAVGAPVEIEFAVRLGRGEAARSDFGFLQLRPLALRRESEAIEIGAYAPSSVLCESARVLGNGVIAGLRDLVVVDFGRFERARSVEAAAEIGRLNAALLAEGAPYLLIGVGRWGSRDPWLGIPVSWDQVCGAAVIVEAGLRDVPVTPSQGSHFFHNLTSFDVGYFTVNPSEGVGTIDWEWLGRQPARSERAHVRHLRLSAPLTVKIDGRRGRGVVLKP